MTVFFFFAVSVPGDEYRDIGAPAILREDLLLREREVVHLAVYAIIQ